MIQINNLEKSLDSNPILCGVNLKIGDSETLCVIGRSGCGKSVLLKHIVGLLKPDKGEIIVDNMSIADLSQHQLFKLRKNIGYVFQGAALFDSLTVYENIILRLYEHNERDKTLLEKEAKFVLSAVGLLPNIDEEGASYFEKEWRSLSNKKPSELSGGMKKRVGVARALVGSPRYIFYDEPTTGLDPVTSEQIDNLIESLATRLKITSLVITHDLFSVHSVADKVAMLDKGKIRFYGTPKELKSSNDEVVQEFLYRYE